MGLNQILNWIEMEPMLLQIAIAVVVVIAILAINMKTLVRRWKQWRIEYSLNRIGSEQLRKLECPDGLDGQYNIDRLVLVEDAILLISYKPYSGNIYCAERISEWTQVIGQKSFKFENPLFEMENQITSLKLQTGNISLKGYLLFDHSADFPKGHPPTVLLPGIIPDQYLRKHCGSPRPEIREAWEALKTLKLKKGVQAKI